MNCLQRISANFQCIKHILVWLCSIYRHTLTFQGYSSQPWFCYFLFDHLFLFDRKQSTCRGVKNNTNTPFLGLQQNRHLPFLSFILFLLRASRDKASICRVRWASLHRIVLEMCLSEILKWENNLLVISSSWTSILLIASSGLIYDVGGLFLALPNKFMRKEKKNQIIWHVTSEKSGDEITNFRVGKI